MASNSLITSEFSGILLKGIAFTNVSLDTPVLKYQPLNNSNADSLAPLALDNTSIPSTIVWLDESYFIVMYENKPYFDLFDSNDLTKISQHVDLIVSSSNASCACAVFDATTSQLYLMDTSNRFYRYTFDKYSAHEDAKLDLLSNFVIAELTETISKMALSPQSNERIYLMSNSLYQFDLGSKTIVGSLNLFVEKTNCFQVYDDYLLISSTNDRFINVVDLNHLKTTCIFVMNAPVIKFSLVKHKKKSLLAAIDQDGFVELFSEPLEQILSSSSLSSSSSSSTASKRRRRAANAVKSIQYNSILKVAEDVSGLFTKVDNMIFDHDNLIISYLQNENFFVLDRFNWFVNPIDQLEIKIARKKSSVDALKLRTQDKASLKNYSENSQNFTIRTGDNYIDLDPISIQDTDSPQENAEDDEDDIGDDFSTLVTRLDKSTNALNDKSLKKKRSKVNEQTKFGFQVGTLTTNISQALRNNDSSLFDSIINTATDENVVKSTISQLEQHTVLKILDKLAELVYKNKFKNTNEGADLGLGNSSINLTTWIRYVLVFHGTYLIGSSNGNADLRRRLGLLALSMKKRAGNMNRLLELKGSLSLVATKAAVIREVENLETNGTIDNDELVEEDVEYIEDEEDVDMLEKDLTDSDTENEQYIAETIDEGMESEDDLE